MLEDGRADGAVSKDKTVMGTYLHGIFDNDDFREAIISALKAKKGVAESERVDFAAFKDSQYNLLASAVREALDMEKLMAIIDAS